MPAPKSPTSLRTPRNVAIEKGTAPAGFDGAVTLPPQPVYKDAAEGTAQPPAATKPPVDVAVPFKIKG